MKNNEGRFAMVAAGITWATALTMLVAVTVAGGPLIVAAWAVMTALWACVLTGWALLQRERCRLETLAAILLGKDARTDADGLRSV